MEHLISVWHKTAIQLRDAKHILLMADYDGTLAPIAEHPDLVCFPADTKQLLESLVSSPRFSVAIISGRKLDDLKKQVRIQRVIYAGNHGLEIEGPGISYENPESRKLMPVFRTMVQVLKQALGAIEGAWVEDKGLSLSIHYRQVNSEKIGMVADIVQRITGNTQAAGIIRITTGKKIYEIRPAIDWDKGKAIKFLINQYSIRFKRDYLLPVFLGDDATDEDGFKVIERYGYGLSVFVGEPTTGSVASYFLNSPSEVATFLSLLSEPPPFDSRLQR